MDLLRLAGALASDRSVRRWLLAIKSQFQSLASVLHAQGPMLGWSFHFLTRLVFPPFSQTGHLPHATGIACIEFQIHAAVDCGYRAVMVDSFLNDPRIPFLKRPRFE